MDMRKNFSQLLYVENWWRQRFSNLTTEQQDEIGRAYIRNIIGAEEISNKEWPDIYEKMGRVHALKIEGRNNVRGFYSQLKGVLEINQEDLEKLVNESLGMSWGGFIGEIHHNPLNLYFSPVLACIISNMVSNK